jgi:excisionase family DNA binding protein
MNISDENQIEGLSILGACAASSLRRSSLYKAIAEGRLRAKKYGKRTLILRSDLQQFLAALPVVASRIVVSSPNQNGKR